MKNHTSIKWIKNNFKRVFYTDDGLQNILKLTDAEYYNSGVYGWNCDIYCDFSRDIAIMTGYRNMAGIRIPDEIMEKYNIIAKELIKNRYNMPYEEYEKKMEENVDNFYNELYDYYNNK